MVKINRADKSGWDEYGEFWICPDCDYQEILTSADYCGGCGKKIKWIDQIEGENKMSEQTNQNIIDSVNNEYNQAIDDAVKTVKDLLTRQPGTPINGTEFVVAQVKFSVIKAIKSLRRKN